MAHPLLDDPFVAAEIDAAVAPYASLLSAEELAWLRDALALQLAEEESDTLQGARPHADVDDSGERVRLGVTSNATAAEAERSPKKQAG